MTGKVRYHVSEITLLQFDLKNNVSVVPDNDVLAIPLAGYIEHFHEDDTLALIERCVDKFEVRIPKKWRPCRLFYIDMGTNIGLQIRKLYEPCYFSGNPVEQIFKQLFHQHRGEVCTFGFEANPVHTVVLKNLQNSFRKIGFRVKIYTETPVSTSVLNTSFYLDPGANSHHQWGASLTTEHLADRDHLNSVNLTSIDIASWMNETIFSRFSIDEEPPMIIMKSDIEGFDERVLTHLHNQGFLCMIRFIYGEHMSENWLRAVRSSLKQNNCFTEIQYLDDEEGYEYFPLPHELRNQDVKHLSPAQKSLLQTIFFDGEPPERQ